MGCGSEPEHEDPALGIAEAGQWAAPVLLVRVGGALDPGHLLPPGDEPGAFAAGDDRLVEFEQSWRAIGGQTCVSP